MLVMDFGRELIRTGDLDPVYVALHRGRLDRDVLLRWLLGFWCFYDAGVASKLAEEEGSSWWHAADVWAGTPASRRGRERRHFRGQKAVRAVLALRERFPSGPEGPASRLDLLAAGSGLGSPAQPAELVVREVQAWPMFGPWIAFKAADMVDRVLGRPLVFDPETVAMYDSPAEAARLLDPIAAPSRTLARLAGLFAEEGLLAPPARDRLVGVPEAETVLCKWGSHTRGHYEVGDDSKELRASLERFTAYPVARRLLECCP